MKTFCAVGLIALFTITTRGQGTVTFANTATTPITTNNYYINASGPMVGLGNYSFGLYIAPFGSTPDTLIGSATNGPFPGRLNGAPVALPNPGTQISFQVRGWSSYAGGTYEAALASARGGSFDVLLGQSSLGFFTVPPSGTISIFGTGPGQVGGFVLSPLVVPEPATYALLLAALAVWGLRRGWRRS